MRLIVSRLPSLITRKNHNLMMRRQYINKSPSPQPKQQNSAAGSGNRFKIATEFKAKSRLNTSSEMKDRDTPERIAAPPKQVQNLARP